MSDLAQPRDEHAERAVLGAALREGTVAPAVSALISPTDIWNPRHQALAEALWDLTVRKLPCDPVAVRAELLRRGHRGQVTDAVWLVEVMEAGLPHSAYYARLIRDIAVRRNVIITATRALQNAADPQADPYDTAASLAVHASALAEHDDPHRTPITSLTDFLSGCDDYDWLVPGLLERGDRLLITGSEGVGKSILSHMIAVCAAAGVHPFTGRHHLPLRVLRVDLENGTRHLRRSLRPMRDHAVRIGRPVQQMHVESRPSGIDLMRPADEQWLRDVCATATPDLLVIGPLYRMHVADMAKEEPARHLTHVLDDLRARHGCAVVVETHAPHAQGLGVRALRPVGSSLFMRWPEFGYGLRSDADDDHLLQLVSWRGARDERAWPSHLRRGGLGAWPFVECDPRDVDAQRSWAAGGREVRA